MHMKKPILGRERRTNPLVWLAAIICAALAVAVIITGIIVFITYMVYQPKAPYVKVSYAQLLRLDYDKSGLLATQMVIDLLADNDNEKTHAGFSEVDFVLKFHQLPIANLQAKPFDVPKNSSYTLNYLVNSSPIPLDASGMEEVDRSLKGDRIGFTLAGQARTRWKVGVFVSTYTHLNCRLNFFTTNGSSTGLVCRSKAS